MGNNNNKSNNNYGKIVSVKSDRISQLPEHIIHQILSFVPIKDAARTCTLSKEWKRVCTSYNIISCLCYDRNSFASQLLLSTNEIGHEPEVCEIRDKFVDFVDDSLVRINQQKSPVLRISLDVVVFNDEFTRVDELMELIGKTKVEELCVSVQTIDYELDTEMYKAVKEDVCYEFPYPSVLASNWLESLTIRWCKFPATAAGTYASLRQLLLEQVMFTEESISSLGRCCLGIEFIELSHCAYWFETTEVNCATSPSDACRNMKELWLDDCLIVEPDSLFEDFTTFPLIEKVRIRSSLNVSRFIATNFHLRILDISDYYSNHLEKIHFDCPNMRHFSFRGAVSEEVYINCPKLDDFRFKSGQSKLPTIVTLNLPTAICYRLEFDVWCDLDTSWFIRLKKLLEQIQGQKNIWLSLKILSNRVEFVHDEFEATPISHLNHVRLELIFRQHKKQTIGHSASLVDGLFWSTYPNTLSIKDYYGCDYFIKNLCGRLVDKNLKMSRVVSHCYAINIGGITWKILKLGKDLKT